MKEYGERIAAIESGGRYDILGPQTRTGDRAYGKYQVMGANVAPWTTAALGRSMTPEEFLADPQAQEAVFAHEFGRLVTKHGPEGAARAWFAGEGGMNDLGRKDVLGTSVADYARKFNGGVATPYSPVPPVPMREPETIASAFSSYSNAPALTFGRKPPQIPQGEAEVADSAGVTDPAFEPRLTTRRRRRT